jgi:hypothetical protein
MQIRTVGKLLAGGWIDMPPLRQTDLTYKPAPRPALRVAEQPSLYGAELRPFGLRSQQL